MAVIARDYVTLATITDVASVKRYYLKQASTLNAPDMPTKNPPAPPDNPNWSLTEPTYTPGSTDTLYTTELVVFSDGTFDYLPVQVSSSFEAAKIAYNKSEAASGAASQAALDAKAAWDKALAAASAGSNLIKNGGFEQLNAAGNPVEWPAPDASRTFSTTNARSGARCFGYTNTSIYGIAMYQTPFATSPGRSYYLEAWVKRGAGTTTQNVGYIVQARNAAGTVVQNLYVVASSPTLSDQIYTKISGTITVTHADSVTLSIGVYMAVGADSTYYYDDLMAVDVTEAVAAQARADDAWEQARAKAEAGNSLVINGGFERLAPGTTDTATGWDRSSTGYRVTTGQRSGSAAFRVLPVASNRSFWSNNGTYLPTSTGRRYYVEGWVKKTGTATANVGFIAEMKNSSGAATSRYVVTSGTNISTTEYTKVSGTINVDTPNATDMRFGLRIDSTTNTYLFDDVIVIDVTEAMAATDLATTADSRTTTSTVAPTPADAAGRPEGAVWFVKTGTGPASALDRMYVLTNVSGTMTWEQTPITQNFVGKDAIGTAQIADASITDAKVGLLSAKKVFVGSTDNLIPNGSLELGDLTGWTSNLTYTTTDKPAGLHAAVVTPASLGTRSPLISHDRFPVQAGVEYLFEVWIKANKPNSKIYLEMRDNTGGLPLNVWRAAPPEVGAWGGGSGRPLENHVVPTTWTKYAALYTPPTNAYEYGMAAAYFNHPGGTEVNAVISMAGLRMRPRGTGELLVDGSISAKHVKGEKFEGLDFWSPQEAVNPLTPNDPRVHIGGGAVEVWRGPSSDNAHPGIMLGGEVDQFTIFDSNGEPISGFTPDGGAVAKQMAVTTSNFTVDGINILERIERLPRGIIANQRFQSGTFPRFGKDEVGLFEMGVNVQYDRLYRIAGSWTMWCATASRALIKLRFTNALLGDEPPAPTIASTELRRWYVHLPAAQWVTFSGEELYMGQYPTETQGYAARFVFTVMNDGGDFETQIPVNSQSAVTGLIEDIGVVNYGAQGDGSATTANGKAFNSVVNTPPTTSKRTFTSVWNASALRAFRGTTPDPSAYLEHGRLPGTTVDRRSVAMFTAGAVSGEVNKRINVALAGSQISKFEIWLEPLSWWYGSGGMYRVGQYLTGSDALPTSPPNGSSMQQSARVPAGAGTWISVPPSFGVQFATLAARGIVIGGDATSQSPDFYGKSRKSNSAVKIRVTYTKTV